MDWSRSPPPPRSRARDEHPLSLEHVLRSLVVCVALKFFVRCAFFARTRGTATVEVRATNDGLAWSNALHFTYTLDGLADGTSVETCGQFRLLLMRFPTPRVCSQTTMMPPSRVRVSTLMQRQISMLQQFVHACCGISSPSEQMVSELMAPTLNEPQRLLGAVVRALLNPPTCRDRDSGFFFFAKPFHSVLAL